MNKVDLDKLVGRFYKAETTPDEEERLRYFFSKEYQGDEYRAEVEYFGVLSEETAQPSDDFEERIMAALPTDSRSGRRINLWIYSVMASAAAVFIAVMVIPSIFGIGGREPADTFTDPRIAYAETVKTLTLVSSVINKGLATGADGFSEINRVTTGPLNSISELQKTKRISIQKIQDIKYIGTPASVIGSKINDNPR
jgi:hypothetical protein